jgi:predicted TIM-barrel fold metal-dependent hydrolase
MTTMKIDVHAHYLTAEYLDLLDGLGGIEPGTATGRPVVFPGLEADLEARFRVMERAGVGLQILSVSGLMPYFADERSSVEAARYANDMYAELVRAYPGKFAAFACLPLPHLDASLAELTRALDQLGMVGVTVATSVLGRNLGDAHFDPIYAELDRRRSVLFIHPAGLACGSAPIKESGLLWPLGGTAEDTLCAVHMMQAGFTARFPQVQAILPHLGGTLPLLMHRLDRFVRAKLPEGATLIEVAKKFWYDTVNGYPPALRCACDTFGSDRLLFGTDYPFFRDDAYQWAADYILQTGLSEGETRAIFTGNAHRLFAGTAIAVR